MKQVYLIAEDVLVIEHGEEVTETRVCHNIGAFETEDLAKIKCTQMNADAMGDNDDPENWNDIYYVLPIDLHK